MLGPSIDKRNEDEDELAVVDGVPFIVHKEVLDAYGDSFELRFEQGRLHVSRL